MRAPLSSHVKALLTIIRTVYIRTHVFVRENKGSGMLLFLGTHFPSELDDVAAIANHKSSFTPVLIPMLSRRLVRRSGQSPTPPAKLVRDGRKGPDTLV